MEHSFYNVACGFRNWVRAMGNLSFSKERHEFTMHWIQLVYIVKEYIVKEYGISLEAKFGNVKLTEKNGKIYNITTDRLFEDNVKRIFRLFLLKNTTLQIIHLWKASERVNNLYSGSIKRA